MIKTQRHTFDEVFSFPAFILMIRHVPEESMAGAPVKSGSRI